MDPTKVELTKEFLKQLSTAINKKRKGIIKNINENNFTFYSLILFARLYQIDQKEKIKDFENLLKNSIQGEEEIDIDGNLELVGKDLPKEVFEALEGRLKQESYRNKFIEKMKEKNISINLLLLCIRSLGIQFNEKDKLSDVIDKIERKIKSLSPTKKVLPTKKKSPSPTKKVSPKKKSPSPTKKVSPKKESPTKKVFPPIPKVDYKKYCKDRYLSDNCDDLSEKELQNIIKKYKESCWNPDIKTNPCKNDNYCDYKSGKCTPIIEDGEYMTKAQGKTIIGNEKDINRILKLFKSKKIEIEIEGGNEKIKFGKQEISPSKKKSPPKKKVVFMEKEEEKKEIKTKPEKKEDSKQKLSDKAERDFLALSKEFSDCLENMK